MAFPSTPLDVIIELFIDGVWTDVTAYIYHRDLIKIRRGLADEAIRADPQTCLLTFNNRDGRFSPRNPSSPYYGKIGRNTSLRVTVDPGTGADIRFVGEVAKWPSRWDVSGRDVWVSVEAAGITRRLGQAGALRSPLYRSMAGVAEGDYVPHAYWPMEDGSDATQFASALPGGPPMTFAGDVSPASESDLVGSDALPTFGTGAAARFVVPTYADTDKWIIQAVVRLSASTTIFDLTTEGTGRRIVIAYNSGGPSFDVDIYDSSGSSVYSGDLSVTSDVIGPWLSVTFSLRGDTATDQFNFTYNIIGTTVFPGFGDLVSGRYGRIVGGTFMSSLSGNAGAGQLAVFTDPNFSHGIDDAVHARAATGWAGEEAHERIERLCREEQVPVSVTGTSSSLMGPQRIATLLELLDDAAKVDAGIIYEPRDELAIAYRTRASRYNQVAALALDYESEGHVSPPLEPVEDDQGVVNDVTITREGGSSGRYELTEGRLSVQDPPDGIGRYSLTETQNLYDDTQPLPHAAWMVHTSAVDVERYPVVQVKLSAAAANSATAVVSGAATLDVGDGLSIANPPAWLPPDTIKQHALGYVETIGFFDWDFAFNCVPAAPYDVGVYDADPGGVVTRYDSGDSTLSAGITSSATSLSVAWTLLGWTHADGNFDINVGGERMTVTAIAGSTSPQTFTVTRSVNGVVKSHSSGAAVVLWDTPRYAL